MYITTKMDIQAEWTGAWLDEQRQQIDGRMRECVCVCARARANELMTDRQMGAGD